MKRIILFLALTVGASAQPFQVGGYYRATGFSPYSLDSLVLRLDASAASSLTYDGSGYVSKWDDLSPLARHATQSTAAAQPVYYPDSLGGRGGVKFFGDGTVSGYDRMLFRHRASASWTVYVVRTFEMNMPSYAVAYYLGGYVDSANTAATSVFLSSYTPFASAGYGQYSAALSGGRFANAVDARFTPALYTHTRGGLWRNGTEATYSSTTDIGTLYTSVIGARMDTAPNLNFRGIIGEVLIFAVAHDATTRAKVEAYLTAKWGL